MKKRTVICSVHIKFDVNTNMGDSFQAEGEIQFQYNSLKSSFQEFIPEHSTSLEPALSDPSSDNIIPDLAPPKLSCSLCRWGKESER